MFYITTEHQGRELLHAIELLGRCLRIPGVSAATRRRWAREKHKAQADLDSLYAGGLRPDFPHRTLH